MRAQISKTDQLSEGEAIRPKGLVEIVRLLARQAAHEFFRKSHETDDRSVEPPGSGA